MEVNVKHRFGQRLSRRCELCHSALADKHGLCCGCRKDLPVIKHACTCCGIALLTEGICGRCVQTPPRVDRIISPLIYRYPVTEIIKKIKYNQLLTLIRPLTSVLLEKICSEVETPPECMIPVPLHFRRWLTRGFNQSIEICKELKTQLQIPYEPTLIRRTVDTLPLFSLDDRERARQLKGAFRIRGEVTCRSVAIVDDLVTTTSTVNAMAVLLRSRGVEYIEVWALARTC